MVVRVLVAVVVTTAVFSSAAFSASPLHELAGTPGPTQVCGNVAVHANAAIDATLRADDAIARSLAHLQRVDFDAVGVTRKQALNDLASSATQIRQFTDRAESESARLRGFGAHPAGDDRKVDLDALAGHLEEALEQQRAVASSLDAFVRGIAYRAIGGIAPSHPTVFAAVDTDSIAGMHAAGLPPSSLPAATPAAAVVSDTAAARAAATDLQPRIAQIEADEALAAPHSEPAIGGC